MICVSFCCCMLRVPGIICGPTSVLGWAVLELAVLSDYTLSVSWAEVYR